MRIKSEIRGAAFIPRALKPYKALTVNQPLLLTREPENRADKNAIVASTLFNEPVGYVAREDAAIVSPQIADGIMWLAKVTGPPRRCCKALLWSEESKEVEVIHKKRTEKA
jgi:HIRAN domain